METNVLYAIASLFITGIILALIKIVERIKFKSLSGSYKATGVMIIIIGIAEAIYLASSLRLLTTAIEVVTSLSAILLFFTFIYLNKLQNAISGMSISLGRRINVGTKIEFEGKYGRVIQIGLTKTIVRLDKSDNLMLIPNKKFDEEISVIDDSQIKKTLN
jgi:hypothetical protein